MRERLEYALVWPAIKLMGVLPRPFARAIGIALGLLVYRLHRRLREVGMRNLTLAFPAMSDDDRRCVLRGEYVSLGRQLAEFCLFPRYAYKNVSKVVVYDGLENYERAYARGKGVLFLTGHLGAWELSAFTHSLNGYPLSIVMRPLDNPYIDRLVQRYRTIHGNKTVSKDDFIRGLLVAMRAGECVGILMDTNMTPPQGVFVNFFGIPAYTASGLARIALRTDAAVIPAFTVWEQKLRKYVLRFDPALELIRTGNDEADIVANTAMFTGVIEEHIRRYPDQWLWLHRRWKTRPEGEPPLY
ncbi:MAG TPA: lysophospholipid acyltransferase family protein [Terriglobales bacterium]|nr:lysophospholipid acyltransferase family protein [Terriglobales bacterium]